MGKVNQRCDTCEKMMDVGWFADGASTCDSCVKWEAREIPYQLPTSGGTVTIVALDGEIQVDSAGCRWQGTAGRMGLYWAEGEDSFKGALKPGPKGAPNTTGEQMVETEVKSWDTPQGLDALEHPAPEGDD